MKAGGFSKGKSINNLVSHSKSVSKGLKVIIQNQFPYEENEWSFYFLNPTVELYIHCAW